MGGGASTKTYELGAVEISAPKQVDYNPSVIEIKMKDFKDSNSDNIAKAIRMTPGVMFENPRGGTGSATTKIRYFGETRTGFYLDGIPMMGAYNRTTDYQFFSTQGISSIQISKGFISPIYGINAMGGAVNIVSSKPEKELDFSLRYQWLNPDENRAGVSIGTNQGTYYFSTDYSYTDRTAYPLPKSFKGTPAQPSGKKSAHYHNQTVKLKLGIQPNESHEYSLNYIYSRGKKEGMYPEDGGPRWFTPHHDKNTIYLLGDSYFTPNLSLNTRLYYDDLYYERNVGLCVRADGTLGYGYSGTQSSREGRCNPLTSYTDKDNAMGAILTLSYDINQDSNFKFGTNLRKDHHTSKNVSGVKTSNLDELTSSIFTQYAQRLSDFRFILAGSYDRLDALDAYSRNSRGVESNEKTKIKGNFSLQGVVYYDISEGQNTHISIGKKQNMPTMSRRYATVFGTYAQNPKLKPESIISYEIGYDLNIAATKVSANIFLDDKIDMIVASKVTGGCSSPNKNGLCSKYVNEDQGYTYGVELGFEQGLFEDNMLVLGANYSYISQNPQGSAVSSAGSRIISYPNHMFNAKIAVKPLQKLEIIGLTTLESPKYYEDGDYYYQDANYFTLDISANYELVKGLNLNAGVLNVTDRENFVAWADPKESRLLFAGRQYFVGFEYQY